MAETIPANIRFSNTFVPFLILLLLQRFELI